MENINDMDYLEKDRTSRQETRKRRFNRIKRNKNLLKTLRSCGLYNEINVEDGYFKHNHEVSKYTTRGYAKKTKTRKAKASYRATQGAYGKARVYKASEKRQIEKYNSGVKSIQECEE